MPRYRAIHTKILDSIDFSDMPNDFTRVMWMLFIVALDSEGRGIDSPAWLRSKLFPFRMDIELEEIEYSMAWLTERGMINRYEVNGRSYFEIPTFKEHQPGFEKEARSVLPPNPNTVDTNSVPTPEEVQSNSSSNTNTNTNTESNTDALVVVDAAAGNIFRLYEQEFGALTPKIADAIDDAIKTYPVDWIIRAIERSVFNNARNWSYTEAILKNWKVHGFDVDTRAKKPASGNGAKPSTNDTVARLQARKNAKSN